MTQFVIQRLPYDPGANAGLALIGQYLRRVKLGPWADTGFPILSVIAISDIERTHVSLLCLGKSDFEAPERLRNDPFVKNALGVRATPSSSTLCQRLDTYSSD